MTFLVRLLIIKMISRYYKYFEDRAISGQLELN